MATPKQAPGFLFASLRVFDLSVGEMLWSRRTIFMGLVVGLPVVLAVSVRSSSAFANKNGLNDNPAWRGSFARSASSVVSEFPM